MSALLVQLALQAHRTALDLQALLDPQEQPARKAKPAPKARLARPGPPAQPVRRGRKAQLG